MKFSKSWLQIYIVEALPKDGEIAEALNKKAFEVEEIIELQNDTVFDIKVLPNRAHDALGHRGMARELCACFGYTFKEDTRIYFDKENTDAKVSVPLVAIDLSALHAQAGGEKACTRFMSVRIDGITVGESPAWLKEKLEAIGQRSINNIVDITNYVQFSLNKPMHAYDARSINGTLRARFAVKGETLTTLDDKELKLDEKTLVIADDEKVLGLAGIKGGKFSGIQSDTTSVILESANFAPTLIRKTGEKYGIKTDASKRFENGIANSLIEDGLYMTVNCIKELFSEAVVSMAADVYPVKDTAYYVGISLRELNVILGSAYSPDDIEETLHKLSFSYEKIIPEEYIRATYPTLVGKAYKNPAGMRTDAPNAFSCSSLVSYLHKGIWQPSISIDKYVYAKKIQKEDLSFGDLIFANGNEGRIYFESVEFLKGTKVKEGVDHVGMYLENGNVIHATKVKGCVVVETLEEFSKGRTITGYGRMADDLKEEVYIVNIPDERLDLRIKEDLAEEIGRIIGYETLKPILPSLDRTGLPHKRMYYENKVREILLSKGFSEVMTYSFGNVGDVALVKGLADDKEKLRRDLGTGVLESLTRNLRNTPLLGIHVVKIFETGNVFSVTKETRKLAIAIDDGGKKSNFTEEVDMILAEIKRTLGVSEIECQIVSTKPYCIEIDFDGLIESLPHPTTYSTPSFADLPPVVYKPISPYPFIVRDIAMWVDTSVTWEHINTLCNDVGNKLVTHISLFDTFSKEINGTQKTSYAFRLVFQSYERTLTDDEVNTMMEEYYNLFKDKGYEIR